MNACIQPLSNPGRYCDLPSRRPATGARRRNLPKSNRCRTACHAQARDRVQRGPGWVAIDSIALSAFR